MYSLKGDSDNSFHYLSKAVEDGFTDFEIINKDSALIFLRNNPAYANFATNGYKISKNQIEDSNSSKQPEPKEDSFEKLKKLSELKNLGIISDEEYEIQRKKFLSDL